MAASFDITFNVKKMFLDTPKIQKQMKDPERKAMNQALGYIRKVSKNSLTRAKLARSAPGKPPKTRQSGDMNLKKILYYYDARKSMGLVGPVKFNKRNFDQSGKPIDRPLPQFFEFGGSAAVREYIWQDVKSGKSTGYMRYDELPKSKRSRMRPTQKRVRRVVYGARPFMGPALELADREGKILDAWKNITVG